MSYPRHHPCPNPYPYSGDPTTLNSGDTAWMLTSTSLVLLMTPGLAFFYGGMVRSKNVLSTMFHSFLSMGTLLTAVLVRIVSCVRDSAVCVVAIGGHGPSTSVRIATTARGSTSLNIFAYTECIHCVRCALTTICSPHWQASSSSCGASSGSRWRSEKPATATSATRRRT